MFIFLQNPYAEILTIDVVVLTGGAVGRWLGCEDGCARIPALLRRDRRAWLPFLSPHHGNLTAEDSYLQSRHCVLSRPWVF